MQNLVTEDLAADLTHHVACFVHLADKLDCSQMSHAGFAERKPPARSHPDRAHGEIAARHQDVGLVESKLVLRILHFGVNHRRKANLDKIDTPSVRLREERPKL